MKSTFYIHYILFIFPRFSIYIIEQKYYRYIDLYRLHLITFGEIFMFEFPCIISLYYVKNQQDATLAVLFISHCNITLHVSDAFCSAVATDLGHPYWIYIIPTHDMHQWLLLQFLVPLMMDAESVRNT